VEDAQRVRDTGVSDDALVDAIHVGVLFNMIARLADSLDWDVPSWDACLARAEPMLAGGYSLDNR
jgi:hypothetical protein